MWDEVWEHSIEFPDFVSSVFQEYDSKGNIGGVVLDAGCGPVPLSNKIDLKRHKRILLDQHKDIQRLRGCTDSPLTVDVLLDGKQDSKYQDTLSQMEAMVGYRGVDAIILSNIINYFDSWQEVFDFLDQDFRSPGMVFVSFGIDTGRPKKFSQNRPKTFEEVSEFLTQTLGYSVETRQYPSLNYATLVAEK